jgi:tagaturonate reductase
MKPLRELPRERQRGPERIIQFGEGNFLRAFVGWMVDKANAAGVYDGSIVAVQPIGQGMSKELMAQDCRYTVILRGIMDGKEVNDASVVGSMSRCLSPYANFEAFLALADQSEIRFVVSNTTEAGIAYSATDRPTDRPPASYPAKLALLLHRRWERFGSEKGKGLVMIPCELIDRNGDELGKIVRRLAMEWGWEASFLSWLDAECAFLNSLVDRIVPGYPRAEAETLWERLGWRDDLLDTAEPFLLWVIEGDPAYAEELPLHKAGLGVVWTRDMTPYRTRKVRILNGAHTSTALAAWLADIDTVGDCVKDPVVGAYLRKAIFDEIIPTIDMPRTELGTYASAVLERFANPYIRHELISISLNSVSKFKARVLPSLLRAERARPGSAPILAFSLAALAAFYRGSRIEGNALRCARPAARGPAAPGGPEDANAAAYQAKDDLPVLERFLAIWRAAEAGAGLAPAAPVTPAAAPAVAGSVARDLLRETAFWGEDLSTTPGLEAAVAASLASIVSRGTYETMRDLVSGRSPAAGGGAGDHGAATARGRGCA